MIVPNILLLTIELTNNTVDIFNKYMDIYIIYALSFNLLATTTFNTIEEFYNARFNKSFIFKICNTETTTIMNLCCVMVNICYLNCVMYLDFVNNQILTIKKYVLIGVFGFCVLTAILLQVWIFLTWIFKTERTIDKIYSMVAWFICLCVWQIIAMILFILQYVSTGFILNPGSSNFILNLFLLLQIIPGFLIVIGVMIYAFARLFRCCISS